MSPEVVYEGLWVSCPPGLGCVVQVATDGNLKRSLLPLPGRMSSVMYLARCTAHSSFRSARIAPTSRVMAASFGKMPTTLVRRLISPLSRSRELVECSRERCSRGKAHVGQHVVLGLVHDRRQLGQLGPELVGDLAPRCAGRLGALLD